MRVKMSAESSTDSEGTLFVEDSSQKAKLVAPILLEKIYKLSAQAVGKYIALPQIVFIGDQPSGKSSVLEGLTDLPFPRNNELCTRFATQIIFRRAPHAGVSASIIPAATTDSQAREALLRWQRSDMKVWIPRHSLRLLKRSVLRSYSLLDQS